MRPSGSSIDISSDETEIVMNNRPCKLNRLLAVLMIAVALVDNTTAQNTPELPYAVPFELGDAEFATGDNITLTQLRGTSDVIGVGQTYCAEGTYTLNSRDEADLSFFATTIKPTRTLIDPKQTVRIKRGTGTFRLTKTMAEDGYLHVTFYAGNGFGGIYFGQGKWVLRNKQFSYLGGAGDSSATATPTSNQVSLTGASQSLCEYLGEPVGVPANLDPAYTRDGLVNAVRTAGQAASVPLKSIEIDDSEFPFLVGVICEDQDFRKLTDQLKKMDGYDFTGSCGGHGRYAINIVPWRAFPPESGQRIGRRLTLRQQVLNSRLQ
jgi:hypothetical protein